MSRARAPCRRGFTLVELLAVLAIVTVLLALLLPALQLARSRALATACQSQIRQAGIRLLDYLIDEDAAGLGGGGAGEWITLQCGCKYWLPAGGFIYPPLTFEGCPKAAPNPLYALDPTNEQATISYGMLDLKQLAFLPVTRQWLLACSDFTLLSRPEELAPERHRGRVGVFFTDGHAEQLAPERVPFAPPPS
jgi:prepilin-type N-terminal cleavage/methylation domain-containing protein/prepilin-type processing-associated H-X9-DG protein